MRERAERVLGVVARRESRRRARQRSIGGQRPPLPNADVGDDRECDARCLKSGARRSFAARPIRRSPSARFRRRERRSTVKCGDWRHFRAHAKFRLASIFACCLNCAR